MKHVIVMAAIAACLLPAAALAKDAASPFDGTWKHGDATTTYSVRGGYVEMENSSKQSYQAPLNGPKVAIKGDTSGRKVSVQMVAARTLEEMYTKAGQVVEIDKITVAPDGKSINVTQADMASGKTDHWTATKTKKK